MSHWSDIALHSISFIVLPLFRMANVVHRYAVDEEPLCGPLLAEELDGVHQVPRLARKKNT